VTGKLAGKIAVIVGAGQTDGETIGNGRATALTFAREGATVICVDRRLDSAKDTVALVRDEGGRAEALACDITDEQAIIALVNTVTADHGRIDILHNNVGVSIAAGDAAVTEIEAEAFERITAINLTGMVLTCKHVLPVMRAQKSGVIVNIASHAAIVNHPGIAYQTSKMGVIMLTTNLAIANAEHGIRCNVICPGLMDTPMAIESRVAAGTPRDDVRAMRNSKVPLGGRMGTAWDVANAALFLASEDAGFVTGVSLVVDGGQSLRRG
jgi:NAD(P)-dependent dehydrogenase (short-subunit alcohol dehydrogenase family)